MRNGRTITIPTLTFNYVDNRLESIGTCGELYIRDHTVEHIHAELRRLVADLWHELHAEEGSAQRRMALGDRMRELGVDDG